MTIDKVVLTSTIGYGDTDVIMSPNQLLTLKFLEEGLNTAGFDNVDHHPLAPIELKDYSSDFKLLRNNLRREKIEDSNVMFAVTAMTEHYSYFLHAVKAIRAEFPKATIIAGGPHFRREEIYKDGKRCKNPIEIVLEKNDGISLVDYVVEGNMEPFIELVTKYQGNIPENVILQGLYRLEDGKVVGKGRGRMPKLNKIPAITANIDTEEGTQRYIHTNFDGRCNNACDFCVGSSYHNFNIELALKSIEELLDGVTITTIHLTDPNPFDPKVIGFYLTLTEELDNRGIDASFMTYLEPADLVNKNYLNHLLDWFAEYNFMSFFIGRDAIDESTAEKIGRKHKGKIRTQNELDAEKEALIRFIEELKQPKFKLGKYDITLSYTFTPFGDYDSTLALINEAEEFYNMSTDKVEIKSSFGILTPFPGTRIRRRYAQHIKDPEGFTDHSTGRNAWNIDFGKQSLFLDYAGQTLRLFETISNDYFSSLRRNLNQAYNH